MTNPLIESLHSIPKDDMIIPEVEYIVFPTIPVSEEIINVKVEEVIAVAEE